MFAPRPTPGEPLFGPPDRAAFATVLSVQVLIIAVFAVALAPARGSAQSPASRLGDPITGENPPPSTADPTRQADWAVVQEGAVPPPPSDANPPSHYPGSDPLAGRDFRSAGGSDADDSTEGLSPEDAAIGRAELAQRTRVLDATWAVLGANGPNYASAVVSLLVSSAEIAVGAVFLELGAPYDILSPLLIATGSVQVARTIVTDFILRPNPQPIAIEYAHMPASTRAQRVARMRFGERRLSELAERSLILRLVDSGISVAGAAAVVGAYMAIRPEGDFEPLELLFFLPPAVSTIVAIVNVFTPSNAERRWDAYRDMRDRLRERRGRAPSDEAALEEAEALYRYAAAQAQGFELTPGFTAGPSAGFISLTGRF